jgi:hypothetical protein
MLTHVSRQLLRYLFLFPLLRFHFFFIFV